MAVVGRILAKAIADSITWTIEAFPQTFFTSWPAPITFDASLHTVITAYRVINNTVPSAGPWLFLPSGLDARRTVLWASVRFMAVDRQHVGLKSDVMESEGLASAVYHLHRLTVVWSTEKDEDKSWAPAQPVGNIKPITR